MIPFFFYGVIPNDPRPLLFALSGFPLERPRRSRAANGIEDGKRWRSCDAREERRRIVRYQFAGTVDPRVLSSKTSPLFFYSSEYCVDYQFFLPFSRLRNPGGVRFGSAEIYDVLDACFSGPPAISKHHNAQRIADSLVVGQMTEDGKDELVVLFVKLDQGEKLTQETMQAIKREIRVRRSARHVPCCVSFSMSNIPVSWAP